MTPPIRFLATAFGSWACLRGAVLVPWSSALAPAPPAPAQASVAPSSSEKADPPRQGASKLAHRSSPAPVAAKQSFRPQLRNLPARTAAPILLPRSSRAKSRGAPAAPLLPLDWLLRAKRAAAWTPSAGTPRRLPSTAPFSPAVSRWTAAAWAYTRSGAASALAPGGQLGGSQAGARLGYRLTPALLLTARAAAPLRRSAGAEAAVGAEWQPLPELPLRLLAERRQAIGRDGRSAFALTVHGGVSELPLPAGFRLDAYGQTGAVGIRSRDLFAEATVRASAPVAPGLGLGAGLWAAAQPDVARIDIGPGATLRLPHLRASLSADWRFRIAGRASPGSGPAITLWKDF